MTNVDIGEEMILTERIFELKKKSDSINIYPFFDAHFGARNCAEKKISKLVGMIAEDKDAYLLGGGDQLECIKPSDLKRFDMEILPDWMLEGDADTIRGRLRDIVKQQKNRAVKYLQPIKSKILGFLEGNHEFSIRKYHNDDVHQDLCDDLDAENLTDESMIRCVFKYSPKKAIETRTVMIYLCHGHGGGRTAGAEPNHLHRLRDEWEAADIVIRGHSHIHQIMPPKPILYMPNGGEVPEELYERYRYACNPGCWKFSHMSGPGSYESRASYPARAIQAVKINIKPFAYYSDNHRAPRITMEAIAI